MKRHTGQNLMVVLAVGVAVVSFATAFTPTLLPLRQYHRQRNTLLHATGSLPDIGSMRTKEMREELESYGIKTRSFLEKSEFVQALAKARAEGKKPIKDSAGGAGSAKAKAKSSTSTSRSGTSTSSSTGTDGGKSRSERIKEEMEKAKSMKTSDLKKELSKRGVSTKSFFEKSEFIKAYAEAIVDGKKSGGGASAVADDEPYDPEYRDVVMQKMWSDRRRLIQGNVIDIKLAS